MDDSLHETRRFDKNRKRCDAKGVVGKPNIPHAQFSERFLTDRHPPRNCLMTEDRLGLQIDVCGI
jgi:hypothetical protein